MISHTVCPLCSSEKISLNLKCTDHFLSKEEFELWKCSECGFIFTRDYPPEISIGEYYESGDYISHDDSAKGLVSHVYFLARKIMLSRKRRIIEKTCHLNNGKLLDIGCGTGHFAATMKHSGWDVTGIEPNKKARDYCMQKFGIDVIEPGKISDLDSAVYDCVTMWHVLEHFHDPYTYAKEISRMLKKGGICIAALPNSYSYDASHYKGSWAAYDVPRHLWHFTPDTFRFFALKTGFQIKQIKSLPFDVFYISILSEKNKGTSRPFLAGIIMGLWFTIKSLFNKNKSSSLIYLLYHQ
jgi:2-polyprenyl-3-methyl-5-hydroxy-6-metoxy-1,4-benzoquinol methylase